MFSPVDTKGVLRGHCNAPQCECDGFCRSANNVPAAPFQAAWCSYCGHSPVQHARIGTTQDVYFSAPSQLPEVTHTQATRSTQDMGFSAPSQKQLNHRPPVALSCTTALLLKLPAPAALEQLFHSISETMPTKLLALMTRALKGQTTSLLQK
ncbi:uncharacterized protein LOC119466321 isoform X1 [Dermacentor silvarum]|uniref:uncharacterized protein LOC119466321 isoform X1 n=1 Tax=Dermacentor silvarum TaxID=543639 RepID=UPI0021008739|nr:uncharacterized protein LOC119466321 isoform X1 [Dermacentor silvarum]